MKEPRGYQLRCWEAIQSAAKRGVRRMLCVLFPGLGKTFIGSQLRRVLGIQRVLILAHRQELLTQWKAEIEEADPDATVALEQGNTHDADADTDIVIGSVPTLCKPWRRHKFSRPFDLVIVDESDLALARTWLETLKGFGAGEPGGPLILGLTGTPMRSDGQELANLFDEVIFDMSLKPKPGEKSPIDLGYLCPARAIRVRSQTSIADVPVFGHDFSQEQLIKAVDVPDRNDLIITAIEQHAQDRNSILVFVTGVEQARRIGEMLRERGHKAESFDGKTSQIERAGIFRRFGETGETRILINVDIMGRGTNIPRIDCCVMGHPTHSATRFTQCLSADTEVLTRRGWCGPDTISNLDEVAAFHFEDSSITWEPIISRVDRQSGSDENMVDYESRSLSLRVTDQHRMVIKRRRLPEKDWQFVTADRAARIRDSWYIPVSGTSPTTPDLDIPDDEIRLIAWILSDGHFNKSNNTLMLYQSEHQPYCAEIEGLLTRLGFRYGVARNTKPSNFGERTSAQLTYYVSRGKPQRLTDRHLRGWGGLACAPYVQCGKRLHGDLQQMSTRQVGIFLEVFNMANGEKLRSRNHPGSMSLIVANRELADEMQSLVVRHGYSCIQSRENRDRVCVKLHLKKDLVACIGSVTAKDRPTMKTLAPTEERVWCVENRIGTLVTRRHGCVAIVGNCLSRGFRLSPETGKQNLLVIDIVDVCGKHPVQHAAAVFGLRSVDALGQDLRRVQKVCEKAESVGVEVQDGDTVEQIERKIEVAERVTRRAIRVETTAEAIDLFAAIKLDNVVDESSEFPWIRIKDEYHLKIDWEHRATLRRDEFGTWGVSVRNGRPLGGENLREGTVPPFRDADRAVKRLVGFFETSDGYRVPRWKGCSKKSKRWSSPVSKQRREALARAGIRILPKGTTDGAAQVMLDAIELRGAVS